MNEKQREFDIKEVVRFSKAVNTSLLIFVALMLIFFYKYDIKLMEYYSIIAIIAYMLYYILLKYEKIATYLWCVYMTITLYMAIATISVGYNYGFHLYCMSIIPIIFYAKYMAKKLNTPDPHPMAIAAVIVIIYMISSSISLIRGPVYTINKKTSIIVFAANSLSVLGFLIYYTKMIITLITDSEEELTNMAHKDQLTGLYNRHYMLEYLEENKADKKINRWIAMLDVDDFKKINDTYGHNCGDYVLSKVAQIMKEQCKNCIISRWGGEEFLVESGKTDEQCDIHLENLRKAVEEADFIYDEKKVKVTVTIGAATNKINENVDKWINRADDNLYYGKNNGKNQVILER